MEAVHSNLRPWLTYFGLTVNVSPKAEVSSLWEPTVSTLGLYSINSPTNWKIRYVCNVQKHTKMTQNVEKTPLNFTRKHWFQTIFKTECPKFLVRFYLTLNLNPFCLQFPSKKIKKKQLNTEPQRLKWTI